MKSMFFDQHIFSSSKARGGLLTFRFTETLIQQKDFLDKIGFYDYSGLLFNNLSLSENSYYSIKKEGKRIFGRSKYLGEELHTNDRRQGNFLAHHLVCDLLKVNINPIQILFGDLWLDSIENQDHQNVSIHIDSQKLEPIDVFKIAEVSSLMSFLKENETFEDIYAIILDGLLDKTDKKIILLDKPERIELWFKAIFCSLPNELLNNLSYVCNLKNRVLPSLCNLIFTDSLSFINEDIQRNSLILDVANFNIKGYECKFDYTANLIEYGIHQNNIEETIFEHQLYNTVFPIGQVWNEIEKGAKFFYFMKEKAEYCTVLEFENFLEAQLTNRNLNPQQKEFIENQIFEKICLKTKNEEKSFSFLKSLITNYFDKVEAYYFVLNEYLYNTEYDYLIEFENRIFELLKTYDLKILSTLLEKVNLIDKVSFNKVKIFIIELLFNETNIEYWLNNPELFENFYLENEKKHRQNKNLSSKFKEIKSKLKQLDAIGEEKGNVKVFQEILNQWEYFTYKIQFIIERKLKDISIDDLLGQPESKVKELYLLVESKFTNPSFNKLPNKILLDLAFRILKNDPNLDIREIKSLNPNSLTSLQNSKLLSNSKIIIELKFSNLRIHYLDDFRNELKKLISEDKDKLFASYASFLENKSARFYEILKNFDNSEYWVQAISGSKIIEEIFKYFEKELQKGTITNRPTSSELNLVLASLYYKYPNLKGNPYRELHETLESIKNLKSSIDINSFLQKKNKNISESNLVEILNNLIQVGWMSYHWQIFYESLKNKDTINYFHLIINWILYRDKDLLPRGSYLMNEMIIYLVDSKKERELEYIAKNVTLNRDERASLYFALESRINQNNRMLTIVKTIEIE